MPELQLCSPGQMPAEHSCLNGHQQSTKQQQRSAGHTHPKLQVLRWSPAGREHREEYEGFLGEDVDTYWQNMMKGGCW